MQLLSGYGEVRWTGQGQANLHDASVFATDATGDGTVHPLSSGRLAASADNGTSTSETSSTNAGGAIVVDGMFGLL